MSRTWGPAHAAAGSMFGSVRAREEQGRVHRLSLRTDRTTVADRDPGGSLKEKHPAAAAAVGSKKGRGTTMRIERRHTTAGHSPYAEIDFRLTTSEIRNPDGSVVFRLENVEMPEFWSQVASDALAHKHFPKAGVPARLQDVE